MWPLRVPVLPMAVAVVLLVVAGVACGSDDGEGTGGAPPGSSSPSGREPLSVEEALAVDGSESQELTVRGALFVAQDEDGTTSARLCGAILESFPPQCGGATLIVEGLDLDSVSVPLESAHDGRLQWAESVTLRGVVVGDRLTVE